ncbi:MAG TPA: patatin-like phospholipase family protein [Candidatus Omnitrophota bacterium]|nr:patatin-like phospholipase family protein [Candidatus Omnitrophota bacterium]
MSLKIKNQLYLLSFILFFLSGCASVRHAVPADLLNSAQVYGMQDIRAFSGSPSDAFKNDFIELLEQAQQDNPSIFNFKAPRITYSMLAISGGSANGAYGAGLLSGWSYAGTRPVFKVVTGISTGAIIAPIAFLGSNYDNQLKEIYTKHSTKDIMRMRFLHLGVLFNDSIARTWPLERIIERYFDANLLKQVAIEHNKGRRLYVGTTNLDAQQLVIWDMGKIASQGDDKALKLFRKIILASSSVPIVFPPVYLDVEVNGKKYDEMHVDGGVIRQVFFLYDVLQGFDKAIKAKGLDAFRIKYAIYVIRNGYVDSFYKAVPDRLLAIAERTVDAVLNAQSIGNLSELYFFTKNGKGDFNLAYLPANYVSKAKEFFDPLAMQDLFDLGFQEAAQGYPWKKSPPGIE